MPVSCPSCAAPIPDRNPGVVVAVCAHCDTALTWDAEAVQSSGIRSRLPQGFTRLFVGASGRLDGRSFVVMGRVRYALDGSPWDEWYVLDEEGRSFWITEDDHELAVELPQRAEAALAPEALEPGRWIEIGDQRFLIEETGLATCVGIEGQLPFLVPPGESYRYADGSTPDGRHTLGVELDDDPPSVFVGEWVDQERLAVDGSAPRPAWEAITAQCPRCAAPLRIPDDRAAMIVCASCSYPAEITGAQRDTLQVLAGASKGRPGRYPIELGRALGWEGQEYEVVARLRWVEENNPAYTTRVYALYHPERPLLFLDEYHGSYTMMHKTHVMPDDLSPQAGQRVKTADGREWRCQEVLERELWHVDGCLPYLAQVGDRVQACELQMGTAAYEIERSDGEIEFNTGRELQRREARILLGTEEAYQRARKERAEKARRTFRTAAIILAIASLGLLANLSILLGGIGSGRVVLSERYPAEALASELTSEPFELSGGRTRVELRAPLDNAWMVVDLALVHGVDEVVYVDDAELSYYSGYEGGEHWSEGSKTERLVFEGADPGSYRLHLRALSNRGETEQASRALHDLSIRVVDGVHPWWAAMLGVLGCLGVAGISAMATITSAGVSRL